MVDSLNIAASGMHAQQMQIDVIANNLANVNTAGFKKSTVQFEDLMSIAIREATDLMGAQAPQSFVGLGTGVGLIRKEFAQGDMTLTDRPLDVAIQGEGFIEVLLPDGSSAYTRVGNLMVGEDGLVVNSDGYPLRPAIVIPDDMESLLVQADGRFMAKVVGRDDLFEIGQMELVKFMNPTGLTPSGDNIYLANEISGDGFSGTPSEDGFGRIQQGALEGSNVALVNEMTNLLLAQRGYEMGAKVVQTSNEILEIINGLNR